ncbi:unnamed protein product [Malus baccata var. baccata]
MASAGDPDIITDFIVPAKANGTVDGNLYIGFRVLVGKAPPTAFKAMKASLAEFPTLNGQSVSYAVLQFPNGTSGEARISRGGEVELKRVQGEQRGGRPPSLLCSFAPATNPPHTHPRSAELLFLIDGTLEVGFVDTKNSLFMQILQTCDLFVFPKGLAHFQYNADIENPALAISTFGSANAGTVSFPSTLFTTGIEDNVLAVSFKTDMSTIQKLKAGLAPKP